MLPVRLIIYDATDRIGGNKILLENGGTALFIDFGTNFKTEGAFFDEFLGPRSTFGFSDLLTLDLLPPLKGLYRSDLEYPAVWDKILRPPPLPGNRSAWRPPLPRPLRPLRAPDLSPARYTHIH